MDWSAKSFWTEDDGAITVDWVVLSAGAVSMAIAATAVIGDGLQGLTSNLEAQLRSQQISDAFVQFVPIHFDTLYDLGILTPEEAETAFGEANALTNLAIVEQLDAYIQKVTNGEQISDTEIADAYALASVAYQRNIVDDELIEYYFSGESGDQNYVSTN
ncbi:MAG: hypothetical protein AAGA70_05810 [Pseudomonadota bacterium]